ncbi:MAG: hypothetical protein RR881_01720 [Malacoplasma sp.]
MSKYTNNKTKPNVTNYKTKPNVTGKSLNSNSNRKTSSKASASKPWFKKKGIIIAMSSTLGAGVLATAVAVPLVMIAPKPTVEVQKEAKLSSVKTIYDLTKKTAKLLIGGENLPNEASGYKVFHATTTRVETLATEIAGVTIEVVSTTEIYLNFTDDTITNKSAYKVELKNSPTSSSGIVSNPSESIAQPSLTITTQPVNKTVVASAESQVTTLSVVVSSITNPINGVFKPTYQWEISETETGTFEVIEGKDAQKDFLEYNARDLALGSKKWFRCKIFYHYMNTMISNPVSVTKISKPIINIATQPSSLNLKFLDNTATLTVGASVEHGLEGQLLTYQWTSSARDNGTFLDISGATSASYVLTQTELSAITPGVKKYYKCKVNSENADQVESSVAYIDRELAPTITITTQPVATINLNHSQTTADISVQASLANGVDNQVLSYQWQVSDNASSGYVNIEPNGTSATYNLTNVGFGWNKYYRCIVSSPNAQSITSNASNVTRLAQPTITVTTQPENISLTESQSTTTLTVAATIANGVTDQAITYQWQSSDDDVDANFTDMAGKTSTSLELTGIANGSSKYYRCKLSSANAIDVITNVANVTRAAQKPVLAIGTQPANQTLEFTATTATAFTVSASVTNGEASNITYQWQSSTTNVDADFTNIATGGNTSSYTPTSNEVTEVTPAAKKYYRCVVSYTGAEPKTSTIVYLERKAQAIPTITVTSPSSQTITSTATSFTLTVSANITNPIEGQSATYQWKKSSTENGEYENIANATNATYTEQLVADTKNSFRDTWYKCEVKYTGATTVTSNAALVKMELTADEAKVELIKYFTVDSKNGAGIMRQFFRDQGAGTYYSSLWLNEFPTKPNTEVTDVTLSSSTLTTTTPSLATYKIKLKTTSDSSFKLKTATDSTTIPIGSFIEFNILFSFIGATEVLKNTTGSENFKLDFAPTFTVENGINKTSLIWTKTNPPSDSNPLKNGAYSVKVIAADNSTVLLSDSLKLSSVPTNIDSSTYKTIPTYNIKTVR